MSLKDCIATGVEGGAIDPERAKAATDMFDALERQYQGSLGPAEAARRAGADTVAAIRAEAAEKARQRLLQADATARIEANLRSYVNGRGEEDWALAARAHLHRLDQLATFSNVEARREAIRGRAQSRMNAILRAGKRDILGRVRNRALLDDVGREAYGQGTGNAAAGDMAKGWAETAEFLRLRRNAAGGRTPKRARWGLPQHWSALKTRRVPFEEWRRDFLPRLDLDDMLDPLTGRPFGPERLELALRASWETIRTDGWVNVKPSGAGGGVGRSLANQGMEHRFLQLKSYDDWLVLMGKYGEATDPFSAMVGHIDGQARDIALMEILGPNPNATLRWLEQTVTRWAELKDADDALAGGSGEAWGDHAKGALNETRLLYELARGALNTPVNARRTRIVEGTTDVLTSIQLGAAAISALSDPNFGRLTARLVGMPQVNIVRGYLKQLNPLDGADREIAGRLGLVLENGIRLAAGQARFVGEWSGPEFTKRLSDGVLRASGLSPWTEAGRHAFGLEFMGFLAAQARHPFAALPERLQATMRRFGLGADSWEALRATKAYDANGVRFLRPEDVAARTDLTPGFADRLATSLLEMVQTMTEYAVPSSSALGRIKLGGASRPGTLPWFVGRALLMYKNFGITLIFTHIQQAVRRTPLMGRAGRLGYGLDLVITSAILGGLLLNLKEIAKGRDPRPMDSLEFWGAALLQGGGLGIFGDLLFSDQNRFGGGVVSTLAGPIGGLAEDVGRFTVGNVQQAIAGDDPGIGGELANLIRRYTPGGSIWYLRLALDRMLFDRLQDWIDPRVNRRRAEQERRWARDFGQRFWWRPGERAPERGPDLGAAGGQGGNR